MRRKIGWRRGGKKRRWRVWGREKGRRRGPERSNQGRRKTELERRGGWRSNGDRWQGLGDQRGEGGRTIGSEERRLREKEEWKEKRSGFLEGGERRPERIG
jgi:hypothetical protein